MNYWHYFLILLFSSILEKGYAACMSPLINDIQFDYQECSVTVKWNPPECTALGYIVQFAQGCSSEWRNSTASGDETKHIISDLSFFAACQINDCYIKIVAEFSEQSQVKPCVGIGDFVLLPSLRQENTVNISKQSSREICVPIKSRCSLKASPSFVINGTVISWPPVGHSNYSIQVDDEMQFNFCFNNLTQNVVLSEICHINSNCSSCPSQSGVVLFKSRTEIRINLDAFESNDEQEILVEKETQITCNGRSLQYPRIGKFCNRTHLVVEGSCEICVCFDLSPTLSNIQNSGLLNFSVKVDNMTETGFTFKPNNSVDFEFDDLLQMRSMKCVEVTTTINVDTPKKYPICFKMQIFSDLPMSVVDLPEQCSELQLTGFKDRHYTLESSVLIPSVIIPVIVLLGFIVIIIFIVRKVKRTYIGHSEYADINN